MNDGYGIHKKEFDEFAWLWSIFRFIRIHEYHFYNIAPDVITQPIGQSMRIDWGLATSDLSL